jgi:hypothetical protein
MLNCAFFLKDSRNFVTSSNTDLLLWTLSGDEPQATRPPEIGWLSAMAVSKENEVGAGTADGDVLRWRPLEKTQIRQQQRPQIHADGTIVKNWINSLAYLKNGDLLIADRQAVWKWGAGSESIQFVARYSVYTLLPLADDGLIAWGNNRVFNVASADFKRELTWMGGRLPVVHALAYSPEAGLMAAGVGGYWENSEWRAAGPTRVPLFDAHVLEQWRALDAEVEKAEKAQNAQKHRSSEEAAVDRRARYTDEAINKNLDPWQ